MRYLRERLQQSGAATLSSEELLSLVLRTSAGNENTTDRIGQLLKEHGGLQELLKADLGQLYHELGNAKSAQLQAVLEIARRLTVPSVNTKYQITSPQDTANLVMAEMVHLDHEELWVIVLNTKNQVVTKLPLYKGTVDSSVLRVAEIFRPVISRKCPNVIVCHNHPTGDIAASPEDISFTQQCVEAGKLLDIDLLDHIIIGYYRFLSLKEQMRW